MELRLLSAEDPGDRRTGTSATFYQARADFKAAWREYLPKRTEADFQEWRDQRERTAEKYRRRANASGLESGACLKPVGHAASMIRFRCRTAASSSR